jgi:hypothetical protein
MKKLIFIFVIGIFYQIPLIHAQGLQPGECGVMFTYDATGSLIQRQFICNNTGSVIYKTIKDETNKNDSINTANKNEIAKEEKEEIVKVNAIMPNPTSGKFTINFAAPLNNANVMLINAYGKVIEKRRTSGNNLTFDISSQPSGMYFVRIDQKGKIFTFKVIKQ